MYRNQLRIANLLLAVSQVLATVVASVTGIGQSIDVRARAVTNPAVPAEYAFMIWGLIYTACIGYGIYQAVPSTRESAVLSRLRGPMASAFLANTIWPLYVQFIDFTPLSVLIIIAMLVPLLLALVRVQDAARSNRLSYSERVFVWFPISIFAGWISVATFVNVACSLTALGGLRVGAVVLPERATAIGVILGAAGLAATVTFITRGNVVYALTVVWALVAIVVANLVREPDATVVVVATGMLAFLGLGLIGALTLLKPQRHTEKVANLLAVPVLAR